MGDRQKRYSSRGDKEEAEQQGQRLFQTRHLPGVGALPISVAESNAARISLTGRQALALLPILERHRAALEWEAEAERDCEFGRGPGVQAAEIAQKIRKGDPRLGKRAITYVDQALDGKATAIFRYSNGAEQIARHAAHPRGGESVGLGPLWHTCMRMMWIFSNRCL